LKAAPLPMASMAPLSGGEFRVCVNHPRCVPPMPGIVPNDAPCWIVWALAAATRRQPERRLDLVLLSIGANDIYFSGLVADVIVDYPTERVLFKRGGVMATVDDSRSVLARDLPQGFAKVREALRPLVGDLSRVVLTSYANPTLSEGGGPCPGGRAGFVFRCCCRLWIHHHDCSLTFTVRSGNSHASRTRGRCTPHTEFRPVDRWP
jgi:hypothetical protein